MNKLLTAINSLPLDERADFTKEYNELQLELNNMQTLNDLYRDQAHAYRVALEREVQHTKRIFGEPLADNVRRVLLTSLKEIAIPTINTSGYDAKELLTTPKPNFILIMREVVNNI